MHAPSHAQGSLVTLRHCVPSASRQILATAWSISGSDLASAGVQEVFPVQKAARDSGQVCIDLSAHQEACFAMHRLCLS